MTDMDQLFDIFCSDEKRRKELEKLNQLRMTSKDFDFYADHKGPRLMESMEIVEPLSVSDLKFKQRVLPKLQQAESTEMEVASSSMADLSDTDLQSSSLTIASTCSDEFLAFTRSEQNRGKWPNLARISERYQLSDRASAAVANAALKDAGLITETDRSLVIDKNKLRRERERYRNHIRQEQELFFKVVDGIYIDGRKDATLTLKQDELSGRYHQSTELIEHYVILGQPGEFYLTHLSPSNGKGQTIAEEVYNAIKDMELCDVLAVIGTDRTASMTGVKNGFIRCLEEKLARPLQWLICLLHCNELPLMHVFSEPDGTTKSPNSFSGPIGKELNSNVSDWPVKNFNAIQNQNFPKLPNHVIFEDLSYDQYYGYRICLAVMSGSMDQDLHFLQLGPIFHSRWLTLQAEFFGFTHLQRNLQKI